MYEIDLDDEYADFWDDLLLDAESSGDPQRNSFFNLFAEVAAENGDCIELSYTPSLKEGRGGYQIDGFAIDVDRGELHIAICDFRSERALQGLNADRIDSLFSKVIRFCEKSLQPEFINGLEETSPTFEATYSIFNKFNKINRIRAVIFSNAKLATKRKSVESGAVNGKVITFGVLDFSRYADIQRSLGKHEPIEVNIEEHNKAPLPCLEAHSQAGGCESYLIVLPGALLAEIYGLYGARLLEQNVRTFLQARTKVNRGIIQTLNEKPEMFFSYNNGLTATASGVDLVQLGNGAVGIKSIHNLQIVNGGQTTASILYAKDQNKSNLEKVYVQMKLSVVEPEDIETVVPLISRYANTQNKVSEADFFSNHPFHVEMEKISRRLAAPAQSGQLSGSKWFYERARGQYKDKLAYASKGDKNKFLAEFPKDKKIDKTDLAKFAITFECQPYMVSHGSQKCFLLFAELVRKSWEKSPLDFNDDYFKDIVAKAIIWKWTDKMIGLSEWYKADRGFKVHTTAYTVAWLVNYLREKTKNEIDLGVVWKEQEVPKGLQNALSMLAPQVAIKIRQTPSNVRDVREYCKQQACWYVISGSEFNIGRSDYSFLIDQEKLVAKKSEAKKIKKIDNELDFEVMLLSLSPLVPSLQKFAAERGFASPKSVAALQKAKSGLMNLTMSEKNALKLLLSRAEEAGFELPL